MKNTAIAAIAAVLAISACAKNPDAIPPVAVSSSAFDGVSCARAKSERNQLGNELMALESTQRNAVVGDAVGVFLIGVPMSSLTGGDKAGEIGSAKGQILALDNRLMACRANGDI